MESKYLEQFKNLDAKKENIGFRLNGSRVLVEIFPPKEIKTASGILLSSPDTYKATADSFKALVGIVLMTGEGYVDSDGDSIEMETKIGQVVVLNEFGMKYYSQFPGLDKYTRNTIAMTSESEIVMSFDSLEELAKYEAALA